MHILITGGAGFIGSHLSKHYIQSGHRVTVIDNLITGSPHNIADLPSDKFRFIQEDVLQFPFESLPNDIDIAFHLASPASPIQYKKYPVETLRVNAEGTYRLLAWAQTRKTTRVVLASTSEVYGDPLEHPQRETYFGNVNPSGERSCYDEAKRYAEAMTMTYARTFGLPVRIARIFNTYGPHMERQDGRVVSNFITQALAGSPITIYGDGSQTRSFCYVSDLVAGLALLGETPNIDGEIINLGNPVEKTVSEIAEMIKTMTQSSSPIIHEPIGADDPKKRKPDITKATARLGWEPRVSLAEGLAKTIAYFSS